MNDDTAQDTEYLDDPGMLATLPEPDEQWDDEPVTRRRWLGRTGVVLAGLVAVAAGFIGGIVTAQATDDSDTASASLPDGITLPEGLTTGSGGFDTGSIPGGAGGGAVSGTVKLVDGRTVYVTDQSGETVRIQVDRDTKVRYLSPGDVTDLKPGDAVTVDGETARSGEVRADTIDQTS